MNIVVTGATSFLGAALCKELVSRGIRFTQWCVPAPTTVRYWKNWENDSISYNFRI